LRDEVDCGITPLLHILYCVGLSWKAKYFFHFFHLLSYSVLLVFIVFVLVCV
jgi:hypothetical protein